MQARNLLQVFFDQHADSMTAVYVSSAGRIGSTSPQEARQFKLSLQFPIGSLASAESMDVDQDPKEKDRLLYAISSCAQMHERQGLLCGLAQCPVDRYISADLRPMNPYFQFAQDLSKAAKSASSNAAAGEKRKKAVSRKRVYKDSTGRMVTETVVEYETCSESEQPPSEPARQSLKHASSTSSSSANVHGQADKKLKHSTSSSSNGGGAISKKSSTSSSNGAGPLKQKSLMSFFGAAPPKKK